MRRRVFKQAVERRPRDGQEGHLVSGPEGKGRLKPRIVAAERRPPDLAPACGRGVREGDDLAHGNHDGPARHLASDLALPGNVPALGQEPQIGLAGREAKGQDAKACGADVRDRGLGRKTRHVRRLFEAGPVRVTEGGRHAPEPAPRRKGRFQPVVPGQPPADLVFQALARDDVGPKPHEHRGERRSGFDDARMPGAIEIGTERQSGAVRRLAQPFGKPHEQPVRAKRQECGSVGHRTRIPHRRGNASGRRCGRSRALDPRTLADPRAGGYMTGMLHAVTHGGPAGRPPLMIAHGLFGSARNWSAVARRMSAARRVVAVDMRNHGASGWSDTHGYHDMAADLAEIIDGRTDVLGHSMGGKAAMVLALTRPETLRRLVVADIAPAGYASTQQPVIDAMRAVALDRIESRQDADAQLAERIADAGVRAFLLQSLDVTERRWRVNLDALEREMPRIAGFPEIDGAFEGPALFLAGADSAYVTAAHRGRIKALFPNARLVRIPGAGHWLHADRPRAFEAAVTAFLDS